ncbi:cold-shock protein [Rheinheimera baltica]|uniref:cold-shock protein n=1 Tax=Rheinheimera baltica TaxID=67576 RepID=UPI00042552AE|nr:cold shock domain-containing protein [Rheinheimera baltica]
MKGKVASYVESKKFGFINGEDNQSYFLHSSALIQQFDQEKLVVGAKVDFDPVPTPKGLTAKKVTILPTFSKKQLVPFFTTKQAEPKRGFIEKKLFISTCFYRDINVAKQKFLNLANEAGCNAILEQDIEKTTFQDGNYLYTVHACRGYFSVVTEQAVCDDVLASKIAEFSIENAINTFQEKFAIVHARESAARANQFKESESHGCLFIFLIGFVLFIFFLMS